MYVCMFVWVNVYFYVCVYVWVNVYVYVCMCECIYVYMCVWVLGTETNFLNLLFSIAGYWLLHCHLVIHSQIGMSVVIKVGEASDRPPIPAGFPKCGNYKNIGAPQPTTVPPTSGGKNYKLSTFLVFLIIVYFA